MGDELTKCQNCNGYGCYYVDCGPESRWEKCGCTAMKPKESQPKTANRYVRNINGALVDIYDLLEAYGVTCHATGHAVKKLLCAGDRGAKSRLQDLQEAAQAIQRAIEKASK